MLITHTAVIILLLLLSSLLFTVLIALELSEKDVCVPVKKNVLTIYQTAHYTRVFTALCSSPYLMRLIF